MTKISGRREDLVLAIIVKHYVETAEPVGSRYVSRRLGLSSATIRNVMADLEDMGYITHPHTSAGRIPTDKGYRYYIDTLMKVRSVNEQMARAVKEEYGHVIRSLENVLENTSHLISNLTNYVGITLSLQNDRLYLNGTSHIIEQPEFKDIKKLYAFLKFLEEKREILNLFRSDIEAEDLMVHIGKENVSGELKECSIVTRGYGVKGKVSGRIGVIGPKRMVYEKVIPTVEFLAETLNDILMELE